MTRDFFKYAWRIILKEKWLSFINLVGLSTGMASFMLLISYVTYECRFDSHHDQKEQIYRVITFFGAGQENILPRTLHEIAPHLESSVPEIIKATRIKPESYSVRMNGETFDHQTFLLTDTVFATIFKTKVKEGNLANSLADPAAVAITESLARKLFGEASALNEIIEVEYHQYIAEQRRLTTNFKPVRIAAILEDPPKNSHLQYDVLQSFLSYDKAFLSTFSNDVFVYFKTRIILDENKRNAVSENITDYVLGVYGDAYKGTISHQLQALTDIHFGPKFGYDIGPRGNKTLIMVYSAIALFILIVAIINYINLVTARTEKRATEAAIRKVSGANRSQIFYQFIAESVVFSLIALGFALVMLEVFITPFSQLLGRQIDLLSTFGWYHLIFLILLAPTIGFMAGVYPASVFATFQPIQILKGNSRTGKRNPLLRIFLVIIQFSISIFLIIAVLVFNRQIDFMKNADLGFNNHNVLVFTGISERIMQSYPSLKAELLTHPGVANVTSSQAFPGSSGSGMTLRLKEQRENSNISIEEYRVGRDFKETYGIKMKAGRWFDFDSQSDLENFVINETALKTLGMNDVLGKEAIMWNREGKIIGIVNDFHSSSLKNTIRPLIITAYNPVFYTLSIRLEEANKVSALHHLKQTFESFDADYNYTEWYLETYFEGLYKQEENNNIILNYASLLAILIAILGLLGLSVYMITSRAHEIAIRKVLGASGINIALGILKEIMSWVVIANFISWPIAWLVMRNWLEGFPYHISLSPYYFIISGIISLIIVIITIGFQTYKVAQSNPVNALKQE